MIYKKIQNTITILLMIFLIGIYSWGNETPTPKIVVLSMPATGYIPFARKYRHLFLAMKKNDGNIITLSLYPKNLFSAGIVALKNSSREKTDAMIITNGKTETKIAEQYFDGNKNLPSSGKFETEITFESIENYNIHINNILSIAKKYSGERLSNGYNALFGPNSNTFIDDIIEESGESIPDIPNAIQQNWGEYELNETLHSGRVDIIETENE